MSSCVHPDGGNNIIVFKKERCIFSPASSETLLPVNHAPIEHACWWQNLFRETSREARSQSVRAAVEDIPVITTSQKAPPAALTLLPKAHPMRLPSRQRATTTPRTRLTWDRMVVYVTEVDGGAFCDV